MACDRRTRVRVRDGDERRRDKRSDLVERRELYKAWVAAETELVNTGIASDVARWDAAILSQDGIQAQLRLQAPAEITAAVAAMEEFWKSVIARASNTANRELDKSKLKDAYKQAITHLVMAEAVRHNQLRDTAVALTRKDGGF